MNLYEKYETEKYFFKTPDGDFSVELKPSIDIKSFFIFSLHKAGSVLINKIILDLCNLSKIQNLNIPQELFIKGIEFRNMNKEWDCIFKNSGYAYSGFREFLPYESNLNFSEFKNILLIRDPRDMLVSLYFSTLKTHPLPGTEASNTLKKSMEKKRHELSLTSIDTFALNNVNRYKKMFKIYEQKLPESSTRIYKYEDVVFKKREWINDMISYLSLRNIETEDIDKILQKHDIIPSQENQNSHIRQVKPGNHKNKLQPETIKLLNEAFEEILIKYNYSS